MDAATLTHIAGELERLVHDIEDAMPDGRPKKEWSMARVDVVRRRAIALIDQVVRGLPLVDDALRDDHQMDLEPTTLHLATEHPLCDWDGCGGHAVISYELRHDGKVVATVLVCEPHQPEVLEGRYRVAWSSQKPSPTLLPPMG